MAPDYSPALAPVLPVGSNTYMELDKTVWAMRPPHIRLSTAPSNTLLHCYCFNVRYKVKLQINDPDCCSSRAGEICPPGLKDR